MSPENTQEYITDYYYAALEELSHGTSRAELVEMVKQFEQDEVYLACAGIKKAIEFSDMQVLTQTIVRIKETNNIKFIDED